MYCRLFVARIYHANAFAHAAIVNSGNMSTAQCKDDFDALALEGSGDQPAAVDEAHDELRFTHSIPISHACCKSARE